MAFNEHIVNLVKDPKGYAQRLKNALDFRGTFTETFIEQQYLWLLQTLKPNTTLVDIGGHMGDTAVYFAASPKVKKVIAYEPSTKLYKEALHNVTMSPFKDKIQFNRIAVGKQNQSIIYDNEKGGVRYIALDDVLRRLKNVAIKCDCEGGERYIFKGVNLKEVYAMQIEYHFNCVGALARDLKEAGFKAKRKNQTTPQINWLYVKR